TSADCLGNVIREGCASVVELAHGPTPPDARDPQRTWPEWPFLLRRYAVHGEGGMREFQVRTKRFSGRDGRVSALHATRVEVPDLAATGWRRTVEGEAIEMDVDMVLLAIGFAGVESADGLRAKLGVELSGRETIVAGAEGETAVPGVYAAGDCVRG